MNACEVDRVHLLTEAIYKNLLDNFSPGVKQLVTTGRNLQKSLVAVSNTSKAYIDCIYGLAKGAQVCKGATAEIGTALLQIAEVHKEINTQVLDTVRALNSELLHPMDSQHDNELKQIQSMHKKYTAGHKYYAAPYEKSQLALKKQRKKNKNKPGFDHKEVQYKREVGESVAKLEEYHFAQLREVLLLERQKYCGFLEKMCTVVRNYASHHSKAHELLTHRLSEWTDLCRNPHVLPASSEGVVTAFKLSHQEHMYSTAEEMRELRRRASMEFTRQGSNSGSNPSSNQDSFSFSINNAGDNFLNNTFCCQDNDSLTYGAANTTPFLNSPLTNGNMMSQDDYAVAGLQRSIMYNDTPSRRQVRAIYTHEASDSGQINFKEGDIINLLGEAKNGWQFGEVMKTHRLGWFPISFTHPLQTGSADAHVSLTNRVKSLGNLREVTDEDYQIQHANSQNPLPVTSGTYNFHPYAGDVGMDPGGGAGSGSGKKSRPSSMYQEQQLHNHSQQQHNGAGSDVMKNKNTSGNNDNVMNAIYDKVYDFGRDDLNSLNSKISSLTLPHERSTPSPPLPPPPSSPPAHQPVTYHHHHQTPPAGPAPPPPPPNHLPPPPHGLSNQLPPPPSPSTFNHNNSASQQQYQQQQHYQHNRRMMHTNTAPTINTAGLQPPPDPMYDYHPRNINNNNNSSFVSSNNSTATLTSREDGKTTPLTPTATSRKDFNNYSPANSSSGYSSSNASYIGGNYQGAPPPAGRPPPPPEFQDGEQRDNPFAQVTLKKTNLFNRAAPKM